MNVNKRLTKQRYRRKYRVRNHVRRTTKPRLSVFRSNAHMYAQIIDDSSGRTLASASTLDKEISSAGAGDNREAATRVGKLIAERAEAHGIKYVVFDRGPCRYHGRIAALATAAREGGLQF